MKQKAELSEEVEELRQMIDAMEVGLEKTQEIRPKTLELKINLRRIQFTRKVWAKIMEEIHEECPNVNITVEFQ